MNSIEQSESANRRSPASRSYWLYVWRGSKYRLGHPVEYSEPPERFTAICDEEAAEIAAERAAEAVIWELHDGNALDANTKQIASKHRPLVMPNDQAEARRVKSKPMKSKTTIRTATALAVASSVLFCVMAQDNPKNWKGKPPEESFMWKSNPYPSKAYAPGAYGKVKDAPMFICWREWDGEIRLGGVAKSLSGQCNLGDIGEYFAVEIQGASGCANHEQLLFGTGTTNIVVGTNYTGTIQIGTNFYTRKDFADLAVIPKGNFEIWRERK